MLLKQDTLIEDVGFPNGSVVKNPPANAGDASLIPGSGRSPGDLVFLPGKFHAQRSLAVTAHGVARVRHDLVTK